MVLRAGVITRVKDLSLIADARVNIYDCNMFIIQATSVCSFTSDDRNLFC
jgi:hypothetical protein